MSKTRNLIHIVFATHKRERTLFPERREEIYRYMTGIINANKCHLIQIGGIEDHVHILVDLNASVSLAELVKAIKGNTTRWISANRIFPMYGGWGKEYYACSVSNSHASAVTAYIAGQVEHHKHVDTTAELWNMCRKAGLAPHQDDLM